MNGFVTTAGAVCFGIVLIAAVILLAVWIERKNEKYYAKMAREIEESKHDMHNLIYRLEVLEARVQEHILDGRG